MQRDVRKDFIQYWEELGKAEEKSNIIDLGMGMPTPELLSSALENTADFDFCYQHQELRPHYQPQAGTNILRSKLAMLENWKTNQQYQLSHVMLTSGALRGFSLAINSLVNKARILPKFIEVVPSYPLLSGHVRNIIEGRGGSLETHLTKVRMNEDYADLQARDVTEHIDDNTIVFLTNPNNPTGRYLAPSVLREIIEVCEKHTDAYVIVDECADIPFDNWQRERGILMRESLIRIHSFSKQYLLAGIRLGYIVADPSLIERFANDYCFSDGNAPIVANAALLHYLEDDTLLEKISESARYHVESTIRLLRETNTEYIKPEACYYMLIKIGSPTPSWPLFKHLLDEGVNVLPGVLFGLPENDSWLRICCARPNDVLQSGLSRIIMGAAPVIATEI